ncbi:hypothetical protein VPHD148_0219 [Vibrio phage D148]
MNAFKRQVRIEDVTEAEALCGLIQSIVFRAEFWEIAETFGCEFTCNDAGEMIDPDFTPMIGTWWVHFEFDFDRMGDVITKYVLRINPEIQTASEIITEYDTAKQYIIDNNHLYEKIRKGMERMGENPFDGMEHQELLAAVNEFDREKFFEMDKRRDLAAGDPNPYTDYTGFEKQWSYL